MSIHTEIIVALYLALVGQLISLGALISGRIAGERSWKRREAARLKKMEQADNGSL